MTRISLPRYQLNIDGTVAAYRFGALLAGNSLVIKQKSDYTEHFYSALRPGEHYLETARDGSDILAVRDWARAHDHRAQKISARARAFTRDHLRPEDMYCYHYDALARFARVQKFRPRIHANMTRVTDPDTIQCKCPTPRVRAEPPKPTPSATPGVPHTVPAASEPVQEATDTRDSAVIAVVVALAALLAVAVVLRRRSAKANTAPTADTRAAKAKSRKDR